MEKNRWIPIILTILMTLEIFYFSSLTAAGAPSTRSNLPAIAYHFIAFFLFSFFLFVSIVGRGKIKIKYIIIVLIISLVHAFLDEFHQTFVPGRGASLNDVIIDSTGILISTIIYSLVSIKKYKKQKLKNKSNT